MADEKKKTGYQSPWEDQLKETANKILNREKFSYDVNGDALYKQYKDRYTQQGKQAMMDTMGQAQAMTGGYGNSYAQSVGQQTYQGYMQGLTDKIPTLYQIAMDKYTNEGNQMRDNMNLMMQQDEIGYGRFRDQVGDQQWQDTFDYGKARDEIADQQWRETFDYSKSRDQLSDQQNAYSKLMALMTGYGYKPSEAEMKAAGMSKAQRDAILRLGAYAPAPVYYEEEEPRKGAYVDPNAEDPEEPVEPPKTDTPTFATVSKTAQDQKDAGVSAREINDYLNAARQAGVITTDQRKSLKYTFGL